MLGVVITAAGSGQRFGGSVPKQYQDLLGKPVFLHSLERFLQHEIVSKVVVVIGSNHHELYQSAIKTSVWSDNGKLLPPVEGAETRQASVKQGLLALGSNEITQVLIHDAARPLVTDELINNLYTALKTAPAAVPVLPPVDSLKTVNWSTNRLIATLPREEVGRVRAPQAFDFKTVCDLHEQFDSQDFPDDSELFLKAGLEVKTVPCSESLIKVTREEDLETLRAIMTKDQQSYEYRTGIGFDVHAFDENQDRPLTLCGIEFVGHKPLKGHSDADVALHTITDALLGAIAEGDIGTHFPPSDPQWRGVDSVVFLKHAVSLVSKRSGKITSVDLTIICEAPKVTPRRQEMRERLAEVLNISIERISVKGTTTEKLGFTGRREGIAAQAVVSVALPQDGSL